MLNYIETPSEFSDMCKTLSTGNAFFHCVYDAGIHPVYVNPIAIFIYHDTTDSKFVMSFSHPDVIPISKKCIPTLINTDCKKYIIDKKNSVHFMDVSEFIDISFDKYTKTLEQTSVNYPVCKDLRSVPIMTLKKSFDDTLKLLKKYIGNEDVNSATLSTDMCNVFSTIEKNGMYVNKDIFNLGYASLIKENGCVYGQYNYFTPTTRPSNRFAKINFAALNKKKNERDSLTSRFGVDGGLVMVDYESYHLRLFAEHIKFELPTSSLHEYLGKFYYDKDELTEEEYDMSKKITFNLIFGGISDDVKEHIPFMKKVAEYVDTNWNNFQKNGYVETWLYKRKLSKDCYTDMNPYKLFNYMLQSVETEQNCKMGMKINNHFSDLKSKLVLYHYDAFLMDMHKSEFIEAKKVAKFLENDGKFPLRMYVGSNYGSMNEIKV